MGFFLSPTRADAVDNNNITLTAAEVASTVLQGSSGNAIWRLDFTIGLVSQQQGAIINLTSLQLQQNGSLANTHITRVKLYASYDNVFSSGVDQSLTSGTFDANGALTLQGYSMLVMEEGFYNTPFAFVVVDVSGSAPANDTIRLSMNSTTWFTTALNQFGPFPQTSNAIVVENLTQVTVKAADLAPATLEQGRGAAFLALTLFTDTAQVTMSQLKFSLTNNPGSPGVMNVALYRESGGAGWQSSDALVGVPVTTFGADRLGTFGNLTETLSTTSKTYYLVLSLASGATVGQSVRVTLVNNTYLGLQAGTVSQFQAGSRAVQVAAFVPKTLTMTAGSTAPVNLTQGVGTGNTPCERDDFLRLTLKADQNSVTWTGLRVSLIGILDPYPRLETYLYRDTNTNGVWDTNDVSFAMAWVAFAEGNAATLKGFTEPVGTTPQVYFLVGGILWPTPGATMGFEVPSASDVSVADGDAVSTAGFPLSSGTSTVVQDRPDPVSTNTTDPTFAGGRFEAGRERTFMAWNLSLSSAAGWDETATWTGLKLSLTGNLPVGDIAEVKLYRSSDMVSLASAASIGGDRWVTLTWAGETLDDTNKGYRLTIRPTASATPGPTLGVAAVIPVQLSILAPDTSAVTLGAVAAVTLVPLQYVTLTSPTPQFLVSVTQGVDTAVMKLSFFADDPGGVVLTKIGVHVTSSNISLNRWPNNQDESMVKINMSLVRDINGDGVLNGDHLSANVKTLNLPNNGGVGEDVMFSLIADQLLAANTGATFFITVNPSKYTRAANPTLWAPVGGMLGLSFQSAAMVTLSSASIPLVSVFPFTTATAIIQDAPDTLTLSVNALGLGGEGQWGFIRRVASAVGINLNLLNVSNDDVVVQGLRMSLRGTVPPEHLIMTFPSGGVPTTDIGADRLGEFTNLNLRLTHRAATYGYSVFAQLSPLAPLGSTIGLSILSDPPVITLQPPDLVTLAAGSTWATTLFTIIAQDADLVTVTANEFLAPSGQVPVGIDRFGIAAFVQLTAKVSLPYGDGQAIWGGLTVTLATDLSDPVEYDKVGVRLYRDDGNGRWTVGEDTLIKEQFGSALTRFVTLSSFTETLTTVNQLYFLVLTLKGPTNGREVGVAPVSLSFFSPDVMGSLFVAGSVNTAIVDDVDRLTMSVQAVAPASLTQDAGAPFLKMALTLNALPGNSVQLTTLTLSLLGTVFPYYNVTARLNRDDGDGIYTNDGDDMLILGQAKTFNNTNRKVSFDMSSEVIEVNAPQVYFVRLSLEATATENATVGVTIVSAEALSVVEPDVVVYTGMTGSAVLALVRDRLDSITVYSTGNQAPAGFAFTQPFVPQQLFRIQLKTDFDQAILTSLKFSLTGDMTLTSMALFKDGGVSLAATNSFSSRVGSLFLDTPVQVTLTRFNDTPNLYLAALPAPNTTMNQAIGITIPNQTYFTAAGLDTFAAYTGGGSILYYRKAKTVQVGPGPGGSYSLTPFAPYGWLRGPTPLVKFNLTTPVASAFVATLTAVKISLTGDLPPSQVTLKLYQDTASPFESWTAEDALVAVTAGAGFPSRVGTLSGLNVTLTTATPNFFFVAEAVSLPSTGKSLGMALLSDASFTVSGVDSLMAWGGAASTDLQVVSVATDAVNLSAVNAVGLTPLAFPSYNWLRGPWPFLQINLTTPGEAVWTGMKFSLLGNLDPAQIASIKIYEDTASPGGAWNELDALVAITAGAGFTSREVTISGMNLTLTSVTKPFFLVAEAVASPDAGKTLGFALGNQTGFTVDGVDLMLPFAGAFSGTLEVVSAATDVVRAGLVYDFSYIHGTGEFTPRNLTRHGEENYIKITLATEAYEARWTAMKIGLSGTTNAPTAVTAFLYRGADFQEADRLATATFDENRVATLTNFTATLTPTAQDFTIKMIVGEGATLGSTVGVSLTWGPSLSLEAPDRISPSLVNGVIRTVVNDPLVSEASVPQAPVPVTLYLSAFPPSTVNLTLGQRSTALLWLTMWTNSISANSVNLTLAFSGTAPDVSTSFLWGGGYFGGGAIFRNNPSSGFSTSDPIIWDGNVGSFLGATANSGGQNDHWSVLLYPRILPELSGKTVEVTLVGVGSDPGVTIEWVNTVWPVGSGTWMIHRQGASLTLSSSAELATRGPQFVRMGARRPAVRFSLSSSPTPLGIEPILLSQLTVSMTGSMDATQMRAILYKETDYDGTWSAGSVPLASAVFDASGVAILTGADLQEDPVILGADYFVVLEPLGDSTTGMTFQVVIGSTTLMPPDSISLGADRSDTVLTVIGAQADGVTGVLQPEDQTWRTGEERPWVRITLTSDGFSQGFGQNGQATLTSFAVQLLGNMDPSLVVLTLYRDQGASGWQPDDRVVASLTAFTFDRWGTFTGLNEPIGTSPLTYVITGLVGNGVFSLSTVGISLSSTGLRFSGTDYFATPSGSSGLLPMESPLNQVTLTGNSVNPAVTIPGVTYDLMKISLTTTNNFIKWTGLAVSLAGNLAVTTPPQGLWRLAWTQTQVIPATPVNLTLTLAVGAAPGTWPGNGDHHTVVFSGFEQTLLTKAFVFGEVKLSLVPTATPDQAVSLRIPRGFAALSLSAPASLTLPASLISGFSVVGRVEVTLNVVNLGNEILQATSGYAPGLVRLSLSGLGALASHFQQVKISITGSDDPSFGQWELSANGIGTVSVGEYWENRMVTFDINNPTLINCNIGFRPTPNITMGAPIGFALLPDLSMVTVSSPGVLTPFPGFSPPFWFVQDRGDTLVALNAVTLAPPRIRPGGIHPFLKLNPVTDRENVVLNRLRVIHTGTLTPTLAVVRLYRDTGDGEWSSQDEMLASGTMTVGGAGGFYDGVTLSGFEATLTTSPDRAYFLALSLAPGAAAEVYRTVGVRLTQGIENDIRCFGFVNALDTARSSLGAFASAAVYNGAVVAVGTNVAPGGMPPGTVQPIYQIDFHADTGASATLTATTVRLTGTLDPDYLTLYLARDRNDGGLPGVWDAADTRIGTLSGRVAFGQLKHGVFAGLNETVAASGLRHFLVLSLAPALAQSATVGVTLNEPFTWVAPAVSEPFTGKSSLVTVDGPDELMVKGVVMLTASSTVSQGTQTTVFRLTITTPDTAVWRSLRVSLAASLALTEVIVGLVDSDHWLYLRPNIGGVGDLTFGSLLIASASFGADGWATLSEFDRWHMVPAPPPAHQKMEASGIAQGVIFPSIVGNSIMHDIFDVVVTLSPTAPIGATFGLVLTGVGAFSVDAPDTVAMSPVGLTISNLIIGDGPDTLIVSGGSATPLFAVAGLEQAYLRLILKTNLGDVNWQSMALSLNGALDPALAQARLYRDANANDVWDAGDVLVTLAAFIQNRMGTFSGLGELITTTPQNYFVALSLHPATPVYTEMAITVLTGGVKVAAPDIVGGFNAITSLTIQVRPPEVVVVEGSELTSGVLLSGKSTALLRLSLRPTLGGGATWSSLKISVTGSLAPSDLVFKLYADNGDGVWKDQGEGGLENDLLVKSVVIGGNRSGGFQGLNQAIVAPTSYFVVATHVGNVLHQTVGVTLGSGDFVLTDLGYVQPGFQLGTPLLLVKRPAKAVTEVAPPTALTLAQAAARAVLFELTLRTDQDLAVFRAAAFSWTPAATGCPLYLYRESTGPEGWSFADTSLSVVVPTAEGWATLSGFSETLTETPARYYVVAGPSVTARLGVFSITFDVKTGWDFYQAQTVQAASGATTLTVVDAPDRILVTALNAGVETHRQTRERLYLALTLRTDQDEAVLTTLQVAKWGILAVSHIGLVRWYDDTNLTGQWESGQDGLIGAAGFLGDTVIFSPLNLTVTTTPRLGFLTVELSLSAPVGDTLGLSLVAASVAGVDEVAALTALVSSLKIVVTNTTLAITLSSVNPSLSVSQGATSVTLLRLLISNGASNGDKSYLRALTLNGGSAAADLTALWVASEGLTLGAFAGSGVTRSSPLAFTFTGSKLMDVMGAVAPLASPGLVRVTLTGLVVDQPDEVDEFGLAHVGAVVIVDAPDTVTVAGALSPALPLFVGSSPTPLLRLSAALTSLPPDAVVVKGVEVSLLGAAPAGVSDSLFTSAFHVLLYQEGDGDGTFSLTADALVATDTFTDRRALFLVDQTLTGQAFVQWHVALSLNGLVSLTQVYGGLAGLALTRLSLAGVDGGALAGTVASSLVSIYDGVIHVRQGAMESGELFLTLGATQAFGRLTLSTDRDTLRLTAATVYQVVTHGDRVDTDVPFVRLYQETGGEGWSAEDVSLTGGSFVNGIAQLFWPASGLTLTTEGVTLWMVGTVSPLMTLGKTTEFWLDPALSAPATKDPAVVKLPGRFVVDTPSTLFVGAMDFTPTVVITGEAFPAVRVSLKVVEGGVGVTRVGVRLNALDAQTLAPHLTFQLKEGDRVLVEGGMASTTAQSIEVTFAVREAVGEQVKEWDVYVTPSAQTPDREFNFTMEPSHVKVRGGQDAVVGSTLTTQVMRVVSGWGFATLQISEAATLLPMVGLTVVRGMDVPLARMAVKVKENPVLGSPPPLARLTALRVTRMGRSLPTDVRVAAYLSPAFLQTFDPSQAVKMGVGRFQGQIAMITLLNKPFISHIPRAVWFVAEIQPSAGVGGTWACEIGPHSFLGQGTFDVESLNLPLRTPLVFIEDAVASTLSVAVTAPAILTVTQGDPGVVIATLTAQATGGPGSVISGLQLTFLGNDAGLTRWRVVNEGGESVLRGAGRGVGQLWLTLGLPVTPTPAVFRLLADVLASAPAGLSLSFVIPSTGLGGAAFDTRVVNGGAGWTGALVVRDAPDALTLSARPRPVPWEVSEWTPAFLITLNVDHDAVSLIRMTLLKFGDLGIDDLVSATFRLRMSNTIVPIVTQSLGGGLVGLSFNHQITRSPDHQIGTLELSLSPSVNLTGTLGLSFLGIGVAPDPVTGTVVDTVTMTPVGTSLLRLRNPSQPFPPALVVNARYAKGVGAFGATWGASVKQGTVSAYRYIVLSWKGTSPDFDALALSLTSDPLPLTPYPLALSPEWDALTPWTPTEAPRLLETGLQLAHGMTLYVAVQAKISGGPWSEVAFSESVVVDSAKPQFSKRPPEAIKGKKQMVLSWGAPETGPSGVERYVVERRRGTKPSWEVLVSAQAPRLDDSPMRGEEWRVWYPSSYGHLVIGRSGDLVIGGPQSPNHQITKSLNLQNRSTQPVEPKLAPYLSSTSSILPLEDGTSYYRVKAVSGAGEESEPTVTTKVVAGAENLPYVINEVSNYPNPFDSRVKTTTIVYVLNQDTPITIRIFTLLGELVKEWEFAAGAPGGEVGANEVPWDGANSLGEPVSTGAYVCVIKARPTGQLGQTVNRKIGVKH